MSGQKLNVFAIQFSSYNYHYDNINYYNYNNYNNDNNDNYNNDNDYNK